MKLTFEQAEAMLTPEQRSELAHCVLENKALPEPMTEAQKSFCFGLAVFCEYEQREEAKRYLL